MDALIGGAGEGRRAAKLDMRGHELCAVLGVLLRAAKEFGMDQVEGADIEGRRHADLAAERAHSQDEIEARTAEIETAVDMRRLDIDEAGRANRLGEARKQPHRESRAAAVGAAHEFAVERREVERHGRPRYRRAASKVNVHEPAEPC